MNFKSLDAKQWSRMGPRAMFGQFMMNIAKKNKKLILTKIQNLTDFDADQCIRL